MNGSTIALFAVVPMIVGPVPGDEEKTLTMTQCGGGSVTISLGDDNQEPARDCHQEACHAGNCRKLFDLKQRLSIA